MKAPTRLNYLHRTLCFRFCLAALVSLPLAATAATLTVRQNGTGNYTTINAAAQAAQPGDTVVISAGTYREMVTLPRGGTSDTNRIKFINAPGEVVKIKGSNGVGNWVNVSGNVWSATLNANYFTGNNPYNSDVENYDVAPVEFSYGQVFANETRMLKQIKKSDATLTYIANKEYTWYPTFNVSTNKTTIYANFGGQNPNTPGVAEIGVRPSCIRAATQDTVDFVTIEGLTLIHTANQPWGAYPLQTQNRYRNTASVIEMRSGSNWIIKNNVIGYCVGAAVNLGRLLYVDGVTQPITYSANVLIQGNEFVGCQYAALYNSFNTNSMRIIGNYFHDNYGVAQRGGSVGRHSGLINGHMTTNTLFADNFFFSNMSSWPDAGWQGVIFKGNLFIDNNDWHWELDHGPVWFVGNIFVKSPINYQAQTTQYYHNLFFNSYISDDARTNEPVNIKDPVTNAILNGGTRYDIAYQNNLRFNNIYIGSTSDQRFPNGSVLNGSNNNVYYNNAPKPTDEGAASVVSATNTNFSYSVNRTTKVATITFTADNAPSTANPSIITNAFMGPTTLPKVGTLVSHFYSDAASKTGLSNNLDTDYFGNSWTNATVRSGPFKNIVNGVNTITVWPKP
jgi:hypothetical protein